jgi:hypothetical protein
VPPFNQDNTVRFRKLPKGYKLSSKLSLSKLYEKFSSQSGPATKPIPPLFNISRPKMQFSLPSAHRQFKKAKAVAGVMKQLLAKDETGRGIVKVFNEAHTIDSRTKMCDEAQRRILNHLPPPDKRSKRSLPQKLTVSSVYNHLKAIKQRAGLTGNKRKRSDNTNLDEEAENECLKINPKIKSFLYPCVRNQSIIVRCYWKMF